MHGSLCVCAHIPKLETRTRLVLVVHHTEIRKPSNTGRLAVECLANSQVVVRGNPKIPPTPLVWPEGTQPLLLYPYEDARPITEYVNGPPVTLVVPDGNWRQAFKVRARVPEIGALPCVSLPPGPPSMYRLRTESHEEGLATVEAIARAFGVLEGPHVREAMERVFHVMVERTLWSRGEIETRDVTGGIPEGAERHDPRSGLARAASAESE